MKAMLVEGDIWSERARDWVDYQEAVMQPLYGEAMVATGITSGTRLLDAGCGAGLFCRLAAALGASVTGLDAAEGLLSVARERSPGMDFRVGEMESLPFDDRTFDLVTGFNSFQYAADPVNALREAARVTRPTGRILIATWGPPNACEAAAYLRALASVLSPPLPGAPDPFALSEPGALESLVSAAGLTPGRRAAVECVWRYPSLEIALRGLLSSGPAVLAIRLAGEDTVRAATSAAIEPFRTARGEYALENRFDYLVVNP
jgi:SAM-dependent methyltransferase